ncbi:hypothetical protein L7F22_049988 [Adiantum nelumboides]|nr:hypothetical protein [Adiantum nelumboides]
MIQAAAPYHLKPPEALPYSHSAHNIPTLAYTSSIGSPNSANHSLQAPSNVAHKISPNPLSSYFSARELPIQQAAENTSKNTLFSANSNPSTTPLQATYQPAALAKCSKPSTILESTLNSSKTTNIVMATPVLVSASPSGPTRASHKGKSIQNPIPISSSTPVNDVYFELANTQFDGEDEDLHIQIPEPLDGNTPEVKDALESPESNAWIKAMLDELQANEATGTWQMVLCPPQTNVVGCKWILKQKLRPDQSVECYKARLVAKGFTQKYGKDYTNTNLHVLCITAFQIMVALAAQYNLPLHHIDIRTAFLHGTIDEEVYMSPPPYFTKNFPPDYVCKLCKPIYGLKQPPRQWFKRFHGFLVQWGWEQCVSNPNLYFHTLFHGCAIIGVYVYDIPILASDNTYIMHAIEMFIEEFPLHDNGPISHFLGIEVTRDPHG